jgi:hypothetical protein
MEKQKRHQMVERLFQAALPLTPEERASFLASTCGDDPDLLAEVQSLLSYLARDNVRSVLPRCDASDERGCSRHQLSARSRLQGFSSFTAPS